MDVNKLTQWDQIELRQLKGQNPKGWSLQAMDQLIEWCKSVKQLRSIFINMTPSEWQLVKNSHPKGTEVGSKGGEMLLQTTRKLIVETLIPQRTDLGYHGCTSEKAAKLKTKVERGKQEGYLPDWKAFYLGSSPEHSLGYITHPTSRSDPASGELLIVSCTAPLTKIFIPDAAVSPQLTSAQKATRIKELLELDSTDILMDTLGTKNKYIEMTDSEGNMERIIPWSIATSVCAIRDSGLNVVYDWSAIKFKVQAANSAAAPQVNSSSLSSSSY